LWRVFFAAKCLEHMHITCARGVPLHLNFARYCNSQGSMLGRFAIPLLAVRPRSPALRMLSTRVTMPPGCHFNTPLLESAPLSELMGTTVLLKMDALQPSGSFKDRGMAYLCAELKQRGVTSLISSSGGNAGHAVAVVGRKLGMHVRVIVPQTTKPIMLTKIRAQGAEVTVHGANWNEADDLARELVAADSAAEYVSPYDDPLLWSGHSSIIDELAEAGVRPGGIVASVGGGGLLCGLLEGLERHGWQDTTLITAETEGASCFAAAMEAQKPVRLSAITSVATSLGALQTADTAFERASRHPTLPMVVTDAEAVGACSSMLKAPAWWPPQLTALASWGWLSRPLAARRTRGAQGLMAGCGAAARAGPSRRFRHGSCNTQVRGAARRPPRARRASLRRGAGAAVLRAAAHGARLLRAPRRRRLRRQRGRLGHHGAVASRLPAGREVSCLT
jgi:L-serine/L-threonine ammonia-lyase